MSPILTILENKLKELGPRYICYQATDVLKPTLRICKPTSHPSWEIQLASVILAENHAIVTLIRGKEQTIPISDPDFINNVLLALHQLEYE